MLFASTNYPHKLDEALRRRPGRFDVHIAFNYADHRQTADLYKHFYPAVGPLSSLCEQKPAAPFDQADLESRANNFADKVMGKSIKVSVADIQGYLLLYKSDAEWALSKVEEWAEGVKRQQDANEPRALVNITLGGMTPPVSPH